MNDFFNLVGDYYNNLTNEESILLAILGVLIFFIGVLVGWIVQGMKTSRYRKQLLLLRKERDDFEARYRAGETKQKQLAKELQAVSAEKVAALDRVHSLENDLAARTTELAGYQQENQQLTANSQQNAATIASLNEEVASLRARNEQLAAEVASANARAEQLAASASTITISGGANAGAGQVGGGARVNENLNAYIASAEERFQQLEDRIAWLANENTELRNASQPTNNNPFTGHQPVMNPDLAFTGEPLVIRADTTDPGARTGDHGETQVIVQTQPSIQVPPMGVPADERVDDLTLIDNIGPFLQQKLNEADVFRYEQIAQWSDADIATYTDKIGYIPGIIKRDDWVGQAKLLAMSEAAVSAQPQPAEWEPELPASPVAQSPSPAPAAAPEPAAPAPKKPARKKKKPAVKRESLKIVEGIGPKIQTILYDAGITTLSALADTSAEEIREILAAAGPRLRGHDPKTWPVQAGLAADGKLDELKAWQKELKGGR